MRWVGLLCAACLSLGCGNAAKPKGPDLTGRFRGDIEYTPEQAKVPAVTLPLDEWRSSEFFFFRPSKFVFQHPNIYIEGKAVVEGDIVTIIPEVLTNTNGSMTPEQARAYFMGTMAPHKRNQRLIKAFINRLTGPSKLRIDAERTRLTIEDPIFTVNGTYVYKKG